MPYTPLVIDTRMSDYGYWIVDISVAPGMVVSVMIPVTGITRERAAELALASHHSLPGGSSA